jgi:hypothetical protein
MDQRIQSTIDLMNDNLHRELSLRKLASAVNLFRGFIICSGRNRHNACTLSARSQISARQTAFRDHFVEHFANHDASRIEG